MAHPLRPLSDHDCAPIRRIRVRGARFGCSPLVTAKGRRSAGGWPAVGPTSQCHTASVSIRRARGEGQGPSLLHSPRLGASVCGLGASPSQIRNARVTYMNGDVLPLGRGGLEEGTAPLWRALADPTRRRILDLLRERPRVTGEIAAQFPISRIAV